MKKAQALLKYRGTECLNCFQPLDRSEHYYHSCGQLNSTKKLAFHDFFSEFFAGILAYDSRLYRTLNSLLFNPGKISKDYIEGKRQRYANPYRFYPSASIIFFIVYGLTVLWTITPHEIGWLQEKHEMNRTSLPIPFNMEQKYLPGGRDHLFQVRKQSKTFTSR